MNHVMKSAKKTESHVTTKRHLVLDQFVNVMQCLQRTISFMSMCITRNIMNSMELGIQKVNAKEVNIRRFFFEILLI